MLKNLRNLAHEYVPEITAARRHLHQHPELSWQEKETTAFIRKFLAPLNIELRTADNFYATVAIIRGAKPGPTVGLRADIDALPIAEKSELPYRSQNPGCMHACGHDGHTAVLLGATKILAKLRHELRGNIICVFQPAEEHNGGGKALLASNLLAGFDVGAFFALHAWPYLPAGAIGVKRGAMMSAIDDFEIIIHGKAGHAAHPLAAIDPVLIAAHVITAVQSLVTRERHGADPAVISITMVHGGTADNVIPAEVRLGGTIRTLQAETRERLNRRFIELVEGVAQSFGGRAEVKIDAGYPALVNNDRLVDFVVKIASEIVGASKVVELKEPSMGGEDFAYYLQKYPGAMFRLGVGPASSLHADTFDFNDEALETGMATMATLAVKFLEQ
ncbi:MAG: M20 family metallopeptidase [candidate division KSB1 bacterium]|nr:M20 family metallopeptidase [candidate division KSB1 bacterium]MDZ7364989.1 M20 family metallopeptidase [candidate division KSB1 bacterium]MDZ7403384.1 M20 family metallopeptidase [candidate division KSB1 bacterium]